MLHVPERSLAACVLVALACVGCDDDVPATPLTLESLVVPALDGEPWTVASTPDLGVLNGPNEQPVDFAVWQAADGAMQLVSCIRGTAEPGETRLLFRWQGAAPTTRDWAPQGIFMRADATYGETPGGLQAPYVVRDGAGFRMLYGDWEHIASATSPDGKAFTRVLDASGKGALFDEGVGANTRDPMVVDDGGHHHVFYSAHPNLQGAVYVRTTDDYRTFGPSRLVARGGEAGAGMFSAECPQVLRHEPSKSWFLFRTQHYGEGAITRVYRSKTLDDFGIDDDAKLVARFPFAAPEYVKVDGVEYLFFLRNDLRGVQAARLRWVAETKSP